MIFPTLGGFAVNADDEKPVLRTISVSGQGKISAAPNIASINVGVFNQANMAIEALVANNKSMTDLLNALKAHGVGAKDIQTSNINIQPMFGRQQTDQQRVASPGLPSAPKVVGYQVQNVVRITARDLTKLGSIVDTVVGAGANQLFGISLSVDNPGALLQQARKEAINDAANKAKLLATEAGMVVGPPVTIRDDAGSYGGPVSMPTGPHMMAAPASPTPISPGEQELSATVQVVYELRLPK